MNALEKAAQEAAEEIAKDYDESIADMFGIANANPEAIAAIADNMAQSILKHLAPVQAELSAKDKLLQEARVIVKAYSIFHKEGHGKRCKGCMAENWLSRLSKNE